MKPTMDEAGPEVTPAALRERVGSKPGAKVEVAEEGFTVGLVPRVLRPEVIRHGRRLVVRPTAPPEARRPVEPAALVEEERDRLSHLSL